MSMTKTKLFSVTSLSELWIHIKCNNLNYLDYRYLQNCDESWYCIECCSTIFLFNFLTSNKNFLGCCTGTGDSNITQWKDLENDSNSSLSSKPSSKLEHLVNQFNNANPENGNDPEKTASSKYYDIDEMYSIKIPHKNKSLSLFNINTCSLNKNFDVLQHLLSCTQKNFRIIPISETRVTKNTSLLNNLNFNNSFEFTPTETSVGGTLLYIANHLSYKCCNDLNIYKKVNWNLLLLKLSTTKNQILLWESFTDIHLDLIDFNCNYLNKLLENISKE